ncbi:hypothetical protein QBC47DRAFT_415996 [Echria macrotheca]|uniref:Uncharacterized protein n=1 Tax=Echria macrotheca TaxID=438768 RepID=A0AAJ0B890_9PEZI|nr:hypothetical protein QBC47DRAFT_415996 [Echria macrotheca]
MQVGTAASRPWARRDYHTAGVSSSTLLESLTSDGRSLGAKTNDNIVTVFPSAADPEPDRPHVSHDTSTRDLYCVGLILAWGASLATMATGIYTIAAGPIIMPPFLSDRVVNIGPLGIIRAPYENYPGDHRVYAVSQGLMIFLPLLIQIMLSLLFVCIDSIHATSLRWALWREGRLHHNTNLRLFTSSKTSTPNKWPANLISTLGLVLAFGGATVMTFRVEVTAVWDEDQAVADFDADLGPDRYAIDFNAWGLLGFGIGLLFQAAVCTWCLVDAWKPKPPGCIGIGSWSANPLANTRAFLLATTTTPMKKTSTASLPLSHQPSMRELIPSTRKMVNTLWAIFAFQSIGTIVVSILAARLENSASLDYVHQYVATAGPDDAANASRPEGRDFASVFKYFGLLIGLYNPFDESDVDSDRREWVGLLIECVALAPLLLGLHVAEVAVGIARDEHIWRRACHAGSRVRRPDSVAGEIARHWPSAVVFVCKAVVPWVFGYGFACNVYVFASIFPLLVVSIIFLLLAVMAEYLVRQRPKGAQPSTFGDIRALAALVDDWECERLFWGDKGECEEYRGGHSGGVRIAGTAGRGLADLQPDALYIGLKWDDCGSLSQM